MKKFLLLFLLQSCFLFASNQMWINWDCEEGLNRLQRAEAKANFWNLTRFYECQMRGSYCALASAVMGLNALAIEAPPSKFFPSYNHFTQEEFFDRLTHKIKASERGLSLNELYDEIKKYPLQVEKYESKCLTDNEMQNILIEGLKDQKSVILINFYRKSLNQKGGGHWAPLGAYDEQSDSFLVLDVARFKYPPFWVKKETLIESMKLQDSTSRGFLLLKKS